MLAARDFGWIGTAETERLEATLATMDRLERYRGHFSIGMKPDLGRARTALCFSVDSGNLAGNLLIVKNAASENGSSPGRGAAAASKASPMRWRYRASPCRRHTTQVTFNPNDPVRDRGDRAFAAHPFCR